MHDKVHHQSLSSQAFEEVPKFSRIFVILHATSIYWDPKAGKQTAHLKLLTRRGSCNSWTRRQTLNALNLSLVKSKLPGGRHFNRSLPKFSIEPYHHKSFKGVNDERQS